MIKHPLIITSALILISACGSQQSKVYKKQRSESDIKISYLDLDKAVLKTRFQYHSYVDKTLENIDCDLELNSKVQLKLNSPLNIQLGAFSKEVIDFDVHQLKLHPQLTEQKSIKYTLNCQIEYNKGGEFLREKSELYLNPGDTYIYR